MLIIRGLANRFVIDTFHFFLNSKCFVNYSPIYFARWCNPTRIHFFSNCDIVRNYFDNPFFVILYFTHCICGNFQFVRCSTEKNKSVPSRNFSVVKNRRISSTCLDSRNVSDNNVELNVCINARMRDALRVISERSDSIVPCMEPVEFHKVRTRPYMSGLFYNTILSQITTKCVSHACFSATFRSYLFLCIRFVFFWYVLHDLNLRNRTRADPARSLFVHVTFPASVSRVTLYTHVSSRQHD